MSEQVQPNRHTDTHRQHNLILRIVAVFTRMHAQPCFHTHTHTHTHFIHKVDNCTAHLTNGISVWCYTNIHCCIIVHGSISVFNWPFLWSLGLRWYTLLWGSFILITSQPQEDGAFFIQLSKMIGTKFRGKKYFGAQKESSIKKALSTLINMLKMSHLFLKSSCKM